MTQQIDPRGPRFNAAVTAVLLATVLATAPSAAATTLLAIQAALFGLGAVRGVQRTPFGWAFRSLVLPRLAPSEDREDPGPPRFAQGVGLVFAVVGLVGLGSGLTTLGLVATGLALAAALLNAIFGICLGCEMYLVLRRGLDKLDHRNAITTN